MSHDEHDPALSPSERYLRGDFLRSMAHAIRSPLGVVSGALTEMLHASEDDRVFMEGLARKGVDRMVRLSRQLDRVAELEGGGIEPVPTDVELTSLVRAAVVTQQSEVRVDVCMPDAIRLSVDPKLLSQALDELLHNAYRFAKSRVEVTLREEPERVVVEVADDGRGIAEERRERVFNRYLPARERGADSDLALGLSLARDYVRVQGGSLVLESSTAGGARAVLTLPRA